MLTLMESITLGIVQGLGEFLPISSSAHLIITSWLFEFHHPGLAFDVALHLGTLLAVVCFFWKDWWQIFSGSLLYVTTSDAEKKAENHKFMFLLVALIVATLPAALVGPMIDEWAETTLRHPLIVALNMCVLGAALLYADKKMGANKTIFNLSLKTTLLIGLAQCLALLPGVSRSGVTITAALALGCSRSESARFSFLMATPIVFGACLFKYKYFMEALSSETTLWGIVVASVVGFLSIKYLLKLVQNHSYAVFSYYRFIFGAGVITVYVVRHVG